ncbi:NAD-dependent dehydratase [Alcaligenes sp. 13f]|uniref:NAD-dependent dehydratase n=1 Tax=Alcaligenes sp. 13f TaxID=2841924 RepID=UPI001CF6A46C|nr:NAD-dependent dehydratase [Alcaligenes sp. 13f]MCB4321989.1 NAD-dependent dehydratase [Alcaligenes sp. 13f]
MKLLLAGATGLVGSHVLRLALDDPRIARVTAPVRRPLPFSHPKLLAPVVDYEALPAEVDWWRADAVICTLGTTMKAAGSKAAFRRVDHDYPLVFGQVAHRHGASTYVLNSAVGASPDSHFFYNRVKAALEQDLAQVGFASLTFARPGLIGGKRAESRPAERTMVLTLGVLSPLLPQRWRVCPPQKIAQAMIESALKAQPGIHVVPFAAMSQ